RDPAGCDCAPVGAFRHLRGSRREAEGGRTALSLLGDGGGTGTAAQDQAVAPAAAGLWPRGAEAGRVRQGGLRRGRAQAALALPAAQLFRRSVFAAAHGG